MTATDLATLARRICLQNAIQHDGRCEPKSLVGRIMGGHPEFRADPRGVAAALQAAAAEVNAMDLDAQRAALAAEAPEMLETQKKEKRTGLKELPDVKGKVVLRFAPNPNGPLSLGHSRGLSILAEYRAMYDADLVLRFDDTDPQVKPPLMDDLRGWNGYQMIEEDFLWLTGATPSRIVIASDRIAHYADAARDLLRRGGAYICTCDGEAFRTLKAQGEACPHRDTPPEDNVAAFEDMVAGRTEKGGAVMRVKTDITHKDPALRDWTAYRVVAKDAVHPREAHGEIPRHHAWPLLDFQSAVEDHAQGVTHIIRGKDLMDSTKKQRFLYDHMGWTYPETLYWGRVSVHEFGKFSTSTMRRNIEAGRFGGWDDPRLPCLRALRRRGFDPGALRRFWVSLGLTEKDIAVSMENIEAEDQKAHDDAAPRYFFVPEPVEIPLLGDVPRIAHPMVHPNHADRGRRTLEPAGMVLLSRAETTHDRLRLKDLGNVRLATHDADGPEGSAPASRTATWEGVEMDRSIPIVQWLPPAAARPMTVLVPQVLPDDAPEGAVPELREVTGVVEAAALSSVGAVVQFERFGFVRIEDATTAIWLHP